MSFTQPFSDYEILARVGSGAMGTVFKARQHKLNRIVALKVLRPSLARDTHYVDRLRREARIVASLNHPNIVAGYDLGEEGGYHFFVMEYFDGPSLRTLLSEWGMFPEEQVLDAAMQVAKALDHAYRKGVIHRDIKPGNILIDAQGKVKLTDMGLAKGPTDPSLTRDGATVGTPQYISPEQARNPQECDIRSDLYSLGATLYHMATGQTPFPGETMAQVITKVLHERAASATDLNPKLSDGLSLVIRKLMAKDPAQRYQTPEELLDDLQRVRREEDPEVDLQSLEAAEASRKTPSPWRMVALGLALVAVIASSLWVGSLGRGGGEEPLPPQEFARQLALDLSAVGAFQGKLEVLDRAEAGVANADQERVVADMRLGVLEDLEQLAGEMDDAVAAELGPSLDAWVRESMHWIDTAAKWKDQVWKPIQDRLGFTRLPDDVRLQRLAPAMEGIGRLIRVRDEEYLAAVEAYLITEFHRSYRARLRERDYRRAVDSVEEGEELVASLLDRVGGPGWDELPEPLREKVNLRVTAPRGEALQLIKTSETETALGLASSAERTLDAVDSDLGSPDRILNLSHLRDTVADLEEALRGRFPPSDSFNVDPWPAVEQRIRQTVNAISVAEQNWESEHLDGWLSLAYQILAQKGDFARARELLDSIEAVSGVAASERLDRHRATLTSAQAVAHAVLETLSGVREPLVARRSVDANRQLTLVIENHGDGQFRVTGVNSGGTPMASSLVDLLFSDLLEQASDRAPDLLGEVPDASLGVALCLLISGQSAEAVEYLAPDDQPFFAQEIWPSLQPVVQKRDQALSGEESQALTEVQIAYRRAQAGGELNALRGTLDELRSRFPTVAQENQQVVDPIEQWLVHAERRRDLAGELQDRSPGARVAVDDNLHATVTYPAAVLATNLPEGWSAGNNSVDFSLADVSLARARALQLARDGLPLPENRATHLTALLRFPAVGGESRLWLFECDGIGVALGLLANNSVVVAILELKDFRDVGDLNRALQEPLKKAADEPVAFIVPGAIHQLRIRVNPVVSTTRLHVEVLLDDVIIAADRRNADRRGRVALIPLQPLSVVELELSGDLR